MFSTALVDNPFPPIILATSSLASAGQDNVGRPETLVVDRRGSLIVENCLRKSSPRRDNN
jgi:hypothetical protein